MLHQFDITKPTWLLKPFLLFHLAAFLLLGSWLLPQTHIIWHQLDTAIFASLNGMIPNLPHEGLVILAVMSHKKFDLVMALAIVTLAIIPGLCFPKGQTRHYAFLLFFTFCCLVGIAGHNLGIFHRESPSLFFEWANLLPNVGFETKTQSGDSFPGNHGMVLMTWLIFISLFSHRPQMKWIVLGIVILLVLPRMTVGAHWFTDNLVGGGPFAMVFLAWTCFTPLRAIPFFISEKLTPLCDKFFPTSFSENNAKPVS